MRSIEQSRRGIATVVAVVSLLLVSITLAGVMTRIVIQTRRTNDESIRAQKQQIEIARSMMNNIKLPDELTPFSSSEKKTKR